MATKKQFKDFNKAIVKYLTAIGATKLVNNNTLMDHYSVETIGGNLTVKIETDEHYKEFKNTGVYSVFCCFKDTDKINNILGKCNRLNPYSSKWNFHYNDGNDCLSMFIREITPLLLK
jgi:hypothetical protein